MEREDLIAFEKKSNITLVLTNGHTYTGEIILIENKFVMFKDIKGFLHKIQLLDVINVYFNPQHTTTIKADNGENNQGFGKKVENFTKNLGRMI